MNGNKNNEHSFSELSALSSRDSGFEGGITDRLILSTIAAFMLFCLAAALFFSCREEKKPTDIGSNGKNESTALPSAKQTGGRRADTFENGTIVCGVDVGGLDPDEAKLILADEVERMISSYECVLRHGEERFVLDKSDLKLETSLDDVLKTAFKSGRGEYAVEVRPADDRRLYDAVEALSKSVDSPPKAAELLSATAAEGLDITELERNSRFVITSPVDGETVDREETARLILGGVREAELPVKTVAVSTDAPKLPIRRAVFSTSYNSPALSASGRIHNIKKASALLNSRSLEPGETLSCNAVLGERTKENGWQTATAFASGGKNTEQQYGGGICQVSTTLYNCALMAGLEITERIGHSRKVAYVEGGRDASLSWGSADLVIKNSTDDAVYIFMWTDEEKKCLNCEIYGGAFPEEYDEIAIISELVEVTEPSEPEFIIDESLEEGQCVRIRDAIRGRVYQTYLEYRKDGVPLHREEVAKTPYQMIPALYAAPKPKE
ncbi:MAG: VanW family protein [Clostridia bacterium]|nr:VanW family protein [Clostridia bacterium]